LSHQISVFSASIESHCFLVYLTKTPGSTSTAGALSSPQSLPPRALAVSANAPRGGAPPGQASVILVALLKASRGCNSSDAIPSKAPRSEAPGKLCDAPTSPSPLYHPLLCQPSCSFGVPRSSLLELSSSRLEVDL
jgi:hypothetical protein